MIYIILVSKGFDSLERVSEGYSLLVLAYVGSVIDSHESGVHCSIQRWGTSLPSHHLLLTG